MGETADEKQDGARKSGPPAQAATPGEAPQEATKRPERKSLRPGGAKALVGTTISDRYRIERVLGEGGMGAVYQAEHTLMRKRMAIKVLHPEMTRLPEVVARFEREAMAAAHIDHPHVVTATDFGKLADGSFFLALEFVEGKSLREVIAEGRLELGRSLHIGRQIALALQRAHALKIVHRDLKPENVMLVERDGDTDFVKVLDFGIAKVQIGELTTQENTDPSQPVLTQAGMVYGTPEYMAPEQALGQPVDARADLYALGIILYEMLTGHRPFDAGSKVALLGMQVTAPVPAMASKSAEANVPPEIEGLVLRLLAKESADRLGDTRELIDGMTSIMTQLAAAGRIDADYAPPPASLLTNPNIVLSATSPSLPDLSANPEPRPGQPSLERLLAGKGWIVAAVAGGLGILALVVTIALVFRTGGTDVDKPGSSSNRGESARPEQGLSPDERVKEGIALVESGDYGSGIRKLEALDPEMRSREDVHRALLGAYGATDRAREAMREAGMLLKAVPNMNFREEVKLRVAIRDTALKQGSTSGDVKAGVDEAFNLLQESMGTQGWDDLYDIGYGTAGQQYPKAAARAKTLVSHGPRAKMSPALQVAVDLHAAGPTCAAKKLFDRAASDGDERALALLKQMEAPRIVGHFKRTDTLGCVHSDGSLKKAIDALEDRLKKKK